MFFKAEFEFDIEELGDYNCESTVAAVGDVLLTIFSGKTEEGEVFGNGGRKGKGSSGS